LRAVFHDLLDLVFPTDCAGCEAPLGGRQGSRFCERCASSIPKSVWPIPVEGLDAAWAWADYRGPVGLALRRGKYRPDATLLTELGRRFASAASPQARASDLLVPVPRSWRDLLRTGLEPTSLLAAPLGVWSMRPVSRVLRRRPGVPQAGLPEDQRQENVRGAFRTVTSVSGSRVLLIDDVITTGATARACAQALRDSGASRVALLAVCSPLL
jgi:ComF family protein